MEKNQTDNYQAWCEQWREKFLQMDQQQLMQRLPELKSEGEYLTIYHFCRKLGVNKKTGEITALEDPFPVARYEKLNVYTLFGYVSPTAHFKDDWLPFENLKNTSPFAKAFRQGVLMSFAQTFNGHAKELEEACKRLKGKKLPWSDVGYEIKAFECIPIRFLFWEGDDEFPAQGNMLFDSSATDFIHGESVVTIATLGLRTLAEKAGLELGRGGFQII